MPEPAQQAAPPQHETNTHGKRQRRQCVDDDWCHKDTKEIEFRQHDAILVTTLIVRAPDPGLSDLSGQVRPARPGQESRSTVPVPAG